MVLECIQDCVHPFYKGGGVCLTDAEGTRYCQCSEGYYDRDEYGLPSCVPERLHNCLQVLYIVLTTMLILSAVYLGYREYRMHVLSKMRTRRRIDQYRLALQVLSFVFGVLQLVLWSVAWRGQYQLLGLWMLGLALSYSVGYTVVQTWIVSLPFQLLKKGSMAYRLIYRLKEYGDNPRLLQSVAVVQTGAVIACYCLLVDDDAHAAAKAGRVMAVITLVTPVVCYFVPMIIATAFLRVLVHAKRGAEKRALQQTQQANGPSIAASGSSRSNATAAGGGGGGGGSAPSEPVPVVHTAATDKYKHLRRKMIVSIVIINCICLHVVASEIWVLVSDVAWEAPLVTVTAPLMIAPTTFFMFNLWALARSSPSSSSDSANKGNAHGEGGDSTGGRTRGGGDMEQSWWWRSKTSKISTTSGTSNSGGILPGLLHIMHMPKYSNSKRQVTPLPEYAHEVIDPEAGELGLQNFAARSDGSTTIMASQQISPASEVTPRNNCTGTEVSEF